MKSSACEKPPPSTVVTPSLSAKRSELQKRVNSDQLCCRVSEHEPSILTRIDGKVLEKCGGKRWQRLQGPKTRKAASAHKTVATVRHRLLPRQHGKEGVDGSSPSEGSWKRPASTGLLLSHFLALLPVRPGMEQVLEQPDSGRADFVLWLGNGGGGRAEVRRAGDGGTPVAGS